ncbi:MAG: hypothetical protein GX096_03420 [Clostridiales bacterium]|nr:hypothetical protein [Clostridiales bacterium]
MSTAKGCGASCAAALSSPKSPAGQFITCYALEMLSLDKGNIAGCQLQSSLAQSNPPLDEPTTRATK